MDELSNAWLSWMDAQEREGIIEWKRNVEKLQARNNGKPIVPKTFATPPRPQPHERKRGRADWEYEKGMIVEHHTYGKVDMFGRRNWLNEQELTARLANHFFVLGDTLYWYTKMTGGIHECSTNYRFVTLDGQVATMGYTCSGDPCSDGEQVTHLWLNFCPDKTDSNRFEHLVDMLANIGGYDCVFKRRDPLRGA